MIAGIKHGAICPGYRDLGSIIVENETERVRAKAIRKSGGISASERRSVDSVIPVVEGLSGFPWPPRLDLQPSQSVYDCALNYFYTNFIAPTYLMFLPSREELSDSSTPLGASVQCAALASFAHRLGSPEDVQLARRQYARALLKANEALRIPESTKAPEVLTAIHFLAIFEVSDCSFRYWSHSL